MLSFILYFCFHLQGYSMFLCQYVYVKWTPPVKSPLILGHPTTKPSKKGLLQSHPKRTVHYEHPTTVPPATTSSLQNCAGTATPHPTSPTRKGLSQVASNSTTRNTKSTTTKDGSAPGTNTQKSTANASTRRSAKELQKEYREFYAAFKGLIPTPD